MQADSRSAIKLKSGLDARAFLKSIALCRGDVIFDTAEGDELNLKSALCQYIFLMMAAEQPELLASGSLSVTDEADMPIIEKNLA